MSFISANVLAMTRSTQEPLPYISIWGARATNAALPGSCQTTTRSNATSFLFSRRFTARARRDVRGVKERRVAGRPCMAKPNALIQVEEVRFGAGRVRSHSHMPRLDQRLAFSSQRFRLITIITSRVWAP